MRGRRPRGVQLEAEDIPVLEALVRSGKTEQRVARRARILIEMGRQEREVAEQTSRAGPIHGLACVPAV